MALAAQSSFLSEIEQYELLPTHRRFIEYLFEGHLTDSTMPNRNWMPNGNRRFEHQDEYGWITLAKDAAAMSLSHRFSDDVQKARSYPSLYHKIERQGFRYWRFNMSYTSASHIKRNLRWLVAFALDFDREHLDRLAIGTWQDLVKYVESFGFTVCAVVASATGYHVYLPLAPTKGMWNGEQTIRRYDAVLKAIVELVGSDPHAATPEHYFRTPRPDNVLYFRPVEKPDLTFYEEGLRPVMELEQAFTGDRPAFGRVMQQAAMKKLLAGDFCFSASNGRATGRNNAAFTLSLGMAMDGWQLDQIKAEMRLWWQRIDHSDFPWAEVERAIESAFSGLEIGRYKGVSGKYVLAMTGMRFRPLTPAKAREERQRDHLEEVEADILQYLQEHRKNAGADLEVSQTRLANLLNVAESSLKRVLANLKQSGRLQIDLVRRGRSYVSIYRLIDTANTEEAPGAHPERVVSIEAARLRKTEEQSNDVHSPYSYTYFCATLISALAEAAAASASSPSDHPNVHSDETPYYFFALGEREKDYLKLLLNGECRNEINEFGGVGDLAELYLLLKIFLD